MKRGYADTPLGQIHYVTDGKGEPLLLFHQGRRSWRMYWKLIPLLAKEYRVIAPDNLGFGNSDPLPRVVKIEETAQNMAHVMDTLGVKKAHVFGLHTGNKIAVALAAQFPSRVNSVMLCGQPHSIIVDTESRATAIVSGGTGVYVTKTEQDDSQLIRDWAAEYSRLESSWWHPDVLTKKDLSPETFQGLVNRSLDLMQSRGTMPNHVPAILAYDWGSGLRKVKAPTLFIELATPHEVAQHGRQGEKLVKIVPNSKLVTLEGATGDAPEAIPEEFSQVILGFLRSL